MKTKRNLRVLALKRALDIFGATAGIIVFSPILILMWFLIKRDMGSPVLFRQNRPGKDGIPFELLKFRSMIDDNCHLGEPPVPDENRLTPLGQKLRSTSLDELPELLNILRGDMSLVGPRPLLMEYLPLYSPQQMRRHEVRPGLTGWAQVNGRNAISWEEKFDLDIWYIENQSFWLDLKIIFRTVSLVLMRKHISAQDVKTMPRFTGSVQTDLASNDTEYQR